MIESLRIILSNFCTFYFRKLPQWEGLEWPAVDNRKVERDSEQRRSDWNSAGRNQRRRLVTWTPFELIPNFFLARQGAGVCCASPGACVARFDSTTVTRHVPRDICFMVSPSRIIVIVICSVLTHSGNTRQGTVNVQSCSLRVARRVHTYGTRSFRLLIPPLLVRT